MTRCRRTIRSGFTLGELLVVIMVIGVLAAVVLPSAAGLFSAGADAQGHELMRGLLSAARALAIREGTYAAVHVQRADGTSMKELADAFFGAIVTYDINTGLFGSAGGYLSRRLPGGIAFGEVSDRFVNDSGSYKIGSLNDDDIANFTTFTIVFSPRGEVVTMPKDLSGADVKVKFDAADPLFAAGDTRLWKIETANDDGNPNPPDNGEEGVTAVTIFNFKDFQVLTAADRKAYLDEAGTFLPVNRYTGQIFPRE